MASVVISYPRHAGARFDADYYRDSHMPLVERLWSPHGMTGAEVLWPADEDQPLAAMTVVHFRDAAAIGATMAAPDTAQVMGDVANFTDIQATVFVAK